MIRMILYFLFLIFGTLVVFMFAALSLFFLAFVSSRKDNGWPQRKR